jgi:GDP-4-dehydro-6-deoxy-D-mannose reductase
MVTGARGFAGEFLWPMLREVFPEAHIWLTQQHQSQGPNDDTPRLHRHVMDIEDPFSVQRVLEDARPDAVIHLAGHSNVRDSWELAHATYTTNVMGTLNLVQGLIGLEQPVRFVNVGSGDVYGALPQECLPFRESQVPRPTSPYAASKLGGEYVALQHGLSYPRLDVVLLRPFAHTGPGQSAEFVCPAFARQVAMIEAGMQDPIMRVGNLSARRDLSDVRDIARAYVMALLHAPSSQIFNVSQGVARSIQGILETLLGLSAKRIELQTDPSLLRPVDTPVILGDSTAFRDATGWEPIIPFERTLEDTLDWWREHIHNLHPAR